MRASWTGVTGIVVELSRWPGIKRRVFQQPARLRIVVSAVLLALLSSGVVAMAAEPSGTITWGVHVTLATRWLDTADTDAEITPFMIMYALHDALVKPMPGNINTPSLAES